MSESSQSPIPMNGLIDGRYYIGLGRNGNVGLWDGDRKVFLVIGNKFNEWRIKYEPYYTDESGCFQPFLMVDDGPLREVLREGGWNAHYAGGMKYSLDPLNPAPLILAQRDEEPQPARHDKLTLSKS